MKRDPIVLGENYILSGEDINRTCPSSNCMIVGSTGCGKSTSVLLPTLLRSDHSNPIINFFKEADAYSMAEYLSRKGYRTNILNISHPEKSTISFDPLYHVSSCEDISSLASSIVEGSLTNTVDDYWNAKATSLIAALISAVLMTSKNKGMSEVLALFDELIPLENGNAIETPLNQLFLKIEKRDPHCFAVRQYKSFISLPYRTGSCVRDTACACLSACFSESIRTMMRDKPQFDAVSFAESKQALIIISSALDPNETFYANLMYRDTVRSLLQYAADLGGTLPREIRLFYDDFAGTAPIHGFSQTLSLFRSAGISACLLLQSEQQLDSIYKDEAPIIRQNCAIYVHFPGGFDDKSCEIVSKRMGLPYDEILYAPLGKVFVMRTGTKGVHIPRYNTLESEEYKEYLSLTGKGGEPPSRG